MNIPPSLIRFVMAGAGATITHITVAMLLIEHRGYSPGMANGIAYALATLFSYMVNTVWTFSSIVSRRTAGRFLMVTVSLMFLSVGVASAADTLGLNYLWGIACIVTVVPAATFMLHSRWTYTQRK